MQQSVYQSRPGSVGGAAVLYGNGTRALNRYLEVRLGTYLMLLYWLKTFVNPPTRSSNVSPLSWCCTAKMGPWPKPVGGAPDRYEAGVNTVLVGATKRTEVKGMGTKSD